MFQNFTGTDDYIASVELQEAVNVALALERPLIVKANQAQENIVAHAIANALERTLYTWHVKSTSRAQEGLYVYDAVQRLHDSRFSDRDVGDIRQYIRFGALGEAFRAEKQR